MDNKKPLVDLSVENFTSDDLNVEEVNTNLDSTTTTDSSTTTQVEEISQASTGRPGEEYLTVDPKVPGQDFCVLSFVTPGDLHEKKQMFLMDRFLHEMINEYIVSSTRDMCRRINSQFLKSVENKIEKLEKSKNENHEVIATEMHQIRKELECDEDELARLCTHKHGMELEDILAKYADFKLRREDLQQEFDNEHGKRTSIMGVKFSGAYPFEQQAVDRAKFLAENVERGVHHYVGQSFHWLPFDADPDGIMDNRYQNQQLNEIMQRKRENEEMKKRMFDERKRNMMNEAKQHNESIKEKLRQKYKGRKKKD